MLFRAGAGPCGRAVRCQGPGGRCRGRTVPRGAGAGGRNHVGEITAMIASRHPVMAGKFRNRILEFVFNPENPARKQFGLWKNG